MSYARETIGNMLSRFWTPPRQKTVVGAEYLLLGEKFNFFGRTIYEFAKLECGCPVVVGNTLRGIPHFQKFSEIVLQVIEALFCELENFKIQLATVTFHYQTFSN